MKYLKKSLPLLSTKRCSRDPDEMNGPDFSAARAEKDHKAAARKGIDTIGKNLQNVDNLSPEAAAIVGSRLPGLVKGGIDSPDDLTRLQTAAKTAKASISKQLPGNEAGNEQAPEVLKEALLYFEQIETALQEALTKLKAEAAKDPKNKKLAGVITNLNRSIREIGTLKEAAKIDMLALEAFIAQGGVAGPLAERVAAIAKGELGTQEGLAANKYLGGGNTKETAWCAGFVNWVLEQAGAKGTGSLMARSFTGQSGYGHVGIKIGNTVIAGNSKDAVSEETVGRFSDFNTVANVDAGNLTSVGTPGKAPEIAIVTKKRSVKNRNEA